VGVTESDDSVQTHFCITGVLPANLSFARLMRIQNEPQDVTSARHAEAVIRESSGSLETRRLFIAAATGAGIYSVAR
jgi:hypothetical protein